MDDWRSFKTKSTTESLMATCLNQTVQVGTDIDGHNVTLLLRDFLQYAKTTNDRNPFLVFDSILFDMEKEDQKQPWYNVPDLFSDDDLFQYLDMEDRPPHKWLLVGPPDSGSPVHTDPLGTCAWNALITGAKHWILFHPDTPIELVNTTQKMFTQKRFTSNRSNGMNEDGLDEVERGDLWDDLYEWYHHQLPIIKKNVAEHFHNKKAETDVITTTCKNKNKSNNTIDGSSSSSNNHNHTCNNKTNLSGSGSINSQASDVCVGEVDDVIVRCYEFVQRPGEIVFVPAMWHHAVMNVSNVSNDEDVEDEISVAITQNFLDRSNVALALQIMDDDDERASDGTLLKSKWKSRLRANNIDLNDFKFKNDFE
jgi:hypothetical protein